MDETETSENDLIVCGSCKRSFQLSNIAGFIKHKKFDCEDPGNVTDPKSKTLVCLQCRQKFHTPWGLLKHAQNVHFLQIYLDQAYNLGMQSIQVSDNASSMHQSYSPLHTLDHSLTALSSGQTVQQWIQGIEQEMDRVERSSNADLSVQGGQGSNFDAQPSNNAIISQPDRKNDCSVSSGKGFHSNAPPSNALRGKLLPNIDPGTEPSYRGKLLPALDSAAESLSRGKLMPALDVATDVLSAGKLMPAQDGSTSTAGPSRGKLIHALDIDTECLSRGKIMPPLGPGPENLSRGKSVPPVTAPGNETFSRGKIMPPLGPGGENLSSGKLMPSLDPTPGNVSRGKMVPACIPATINDGGTGSTSGISQVPAMGTVTRSRGKIIPAFENSSTESLSRGKMMPPAPVPSTSMTTQQPISQGKLIPLSISVGDVDSVFGTPSPVLSKKGRSTPNTAGRSSSNSSGKRIRKESEERSPSVSSTKDECCSNMDCCVRKGNLTGKMCDNEKCGITLLPGTHESMKQCCISVIPKKRKRHMETKHKSSHKPFSRSRRREKARTASENSLNASAEISQSSDVDSAMPSTSKKRSVSSVSSQDLDNNNAAKNVLQKPLPSQQDDSLFPLSFGIPQQTLPTINSSVLMSGPNFPSTSAPSSAPLIESANQKGLNYQLPVMTSDTVSGILSTSKSTNMENNQIDVPEVSQTFLESIGFPTAKLDPPENLNGTATPKFIVQSLKDAVNIPSSTQLVSSSNTGAVVNSTMDNNNENLNFPAFGIEPAEAEVADIEEAHSTLLLQTANDVKDSSSTKKRRYPTTRPFKCDQCDRSFNQRIHLKKHQSKHTGIKPFKCDQCDYSTVERSHLRVHVRVHTGEKPFKCPHCDYATAQNSTLKIHLKRHHTGAGEGVGIDREHKPMIDPTQGLAMPGVTQKQDSILALLPMENSSSSEASEIVGKFQTTDGSMLDQLASSTR